MNSYTYFVQAFRTIANILVNCASNGYYQSWYHVISVELNHSWPLNDKISKYFKFQVLRSQILIRFWFLVTLSLWCGRNSFLGRWCWCCMHAKSSTSTALTSQIVQWCTAHMVSAQSHYIISPAVSCHCLYNTFGPALD